MAQSHSLLVFFIIYYTFIQIHSYTFILTHSFLHIHSYTFAEFRSRFFIAASSGRGSPCTGVPSRDSNSGPPYSSPTRYQLRHAAPVLAVLQLARLCMQFADSAGNIAAGALIQKITFSVCIFRIFFCFQRDS